MTLPRVPTVAAPTQDRVVSLSDENARLLEGIVRMRAAQLGLSRKDQVRRLSEKIALSIGGHLPADMFAARDVLILIYRQLASSRVQRESSTELDLAELNDIARDIHGELDAHRSLPTSGALAQPLERAAHQFVDREGTDDLALKRRRSQLPPDASRVLTAWFLAHADRPYPSPREREALQRETGLSDLQLRNWFGNMRKRHWHPVTKGAREPRSMLEQHIGVAVLSGGGAAIGVESGHAAPTLG